MRLSRRYKMRPSIEPSIARSTLAAHLRAAQLDMLHDPVLSDGDKIAGMYALATLAGDLSDVWALADRTYGAASAALWNYGCGLTDDGLPSPEMVRRVAEVGDDSPDSPDGGEHDAA